MLEELFIVTKIREGDFKAFESLFRKYYVPLCLYATTITGRKEVAEEILQDLFYVLWKEREQLQVVRSLKNYLYGAVRNRSLQFVGRQKLADAYGTVQMKVEKKESSPQEILEYEELAHLIELILAKMPARRSEMFRMHRNEGKSYAEMADIYAVSVKTIEAEMTKALRSLRVGIENYRYGKI